MDVFKKIKNIVYLQQKKDQMLLLRVKTLFQEN